MMFQEIKAPPRKKGFSKEKLSPMNNKKLGSYFYKPCLFNPQEQRRKQAVKTVKQEQQSTTQQTICFYYREPSSNEYKKIVLNSPYEVHEKGVSTREYVYFKVLMWQQRWWKVAKNKNDSCQDSMNNVERINKEVQQ